jgi:hypothetical protein
MHFFSAASNVHTGTGIILSSLPGLFDAADSG